MASQIPQITLVNQLQNENSDDTQLIASSVLPHQGMSRASSILPLLPFGSSTLWEWSKSGKFPAPVKLSPTITAWRNRDVLNWLEHWHSDESEINNSDNNEVDGC